MDRETAAAFERIWKALDLLDAKLDAIQAELSEHRMAVAGSIEKLIASTASAHTALMPGTYPGQIRWWNSAPGAAEPPDDTWSVDFIVQPAVRLIEP